jgi:hypothetical protein
MIYKPNEWAFVHVPKNAGTSFVRPLRNPKRRKELGLELLDKGPSLHHNKWDWWSRFDEVKDLTPVGICRNPWSRALSMYLYNIKNAAANIEEEWGRFDHARLSREGFKRSWMPDGFFVDKHGIDFEYDKNTGRAWAQDEPQTSWLPDDGVWFRMEDQLEDFEKYVGYEMPEKLNTTPHARHLDYYDSELIERIGELFAADVEKFGYEPKI